MRTHAAIPALGVGIVTNDTGVALLEVFLSGRLDGHLLSSDVAAGAVGVLRLFGRLGRASSLVVNDWSRGRHGVVLSLVCVDRCFVYARMLCVIKREKGRGILNKELK